MLSFLIAKGSASFSLLVGLPGTSVQHLCKHNADGREACTVAPHACLQSVPSTCSPWGSSSPFLPELGPFLRPSMSSCWWLLVQQGEPAVVSEGWGPWCWSGEQLSLAAQMGVLAQGPTADSSPGASPFPQASLSPAGDSAVLVLPPPPPPALFSPAGSVCLGLEIRA